MDLDFVLRAGQFVFTAAVGLYCWLLRVAPAPRPRPNT